MRWKDDAEAAREAVRQKFGDVRGVIGSLSEPRVPTVGRASSTGVVSLDAALGGPLPSGAIEVYGEASTGKTTLLYEVLAAAQKGGYLTGLCVSEYLDIPYMKKIGVSLNDLVLFTGDCGEDVLSAAMEFIRGHRAHQVVLGIDSATSLRPEDDWPGHWMLMFRDFLTEALEVLNLESCLVLVNQVRVKRSVDPTKFFVDGAVTTTARKIVDLFNLRLELSRGESRGGEHEMGVNIVASTVSKPATMLRIPFEKGEGIDTMKDLLLFGLSLGVVQKAGAWYNLDTLGGPILLGCGMKEAVLDLEEHEEHAAYLLDRVMVKA